VNRKPYPTYRPSGVEWLGEVPMGWEVKRLKFISSIRYGIGEPPEYVDEGTPLIRATNINSGKIETKDLKLVDPRDIPSGRIVRLKVGDIVVVRSGAYTGDSAIISPPYANSIAGFDMVVSARGIEPGFLAQVILSDYFKDGQLYLLKLRAAQPHLNAEELGDCLVLIPSLPEQQAIAAFLDRETARLDTLLAKKRRLVKLLKERRSAVITRAVTRGLDPHAKMQDSGVEWIGAVPAGWETRKLKYLVSINDETLPEDFDPDAEIIYVDIGSIDPSLGLTTFESFRFDEAPSRARRKVRDGDVIISTVRTYLRAVASIRDPQPNLVVSTGFAVLRHRKIEPKYLAALSVSSIVVEKIVARSVGVSYPGINASEIGLIEVPLPPLPEQQAIVAYLDRETAQIDALVAKVDQAIEKLTEYRTALISAAVTGKIDVRSES